MYISEHQQKPLHTQCCLQAQLKNDFIGGTCMLPNMWISFLCSARELNCLKFCSSAKGKILGVLQRNPIFLDLRQCICRSVVGCILLRMASFQSFQVKIICARTSLIETHFAQHLVQSTHRSQCAGKWFCHTTSLLPGVCEYLLWQPLWTWSSRIFIAAGYFLMSSSLCVFGLSLLQQKARHLVPNWKPSHRSHKEPRYCGPKATKKMNAELQ